MREIKFRAWDSDAQIMHFFNLKDLWVEGCETQLSELNDPKRLSLNTDFPYSTCQIEQFTGLIDKNGKEIYEGDIYEYKKSEQEKQKDFYKTKKVVIFSNGSFGFEEWHTDENGRLRDMLSYIPGQITNREFYYIDFDLEIIGNIHQNPEFLES